MEKKTRFKKLIDNPIVNFIIGLILFLSFLSEVWPTLLEVFKISGLRSHHGVGIFGFWHALKAMPDLFEAVKQFWGTFRRRACQGEEREEE